MMQNEIAARSSLLITADEFIGQSYGGDTIHKAPPFSFGNYILESLFHGYASFSFPTLVARRLRFFAGFDLGLGR